MTKMKMNRTHFIGIGGIGMSALARLFLHDGKEVSGSDSTQTSNTEKLEKEGATITYEQKAENITNDIDFVVYTEAMASDHPELVAARKAGIKTINYFEALGMVANEYYLIAVAGTHGKSTTTAMLIDIFEEASYDPSGIVGSLRSKTGSNYRAGKSKYMIVEACEYKRDFLPLEPDVLVITNIEHEHVDYYKNLADVQDAFRTLAEKVPEKGAIICDTSDPNLKPVINGCRTSVIDYRKYVDPLLSLKQPGLHNRLNAAAAIAVAQNEGVSREVSDSALQNFAGIWRRFEYKGDVNGAPVYDDYAHHPTEVRATLSGVREKYPNKKVTIVFQVHNASRALEFKDGFSNELAKADRVFLLPTYLARDEDVTEVDEETLVASIKKNGTEVQLFRTFEAVVSAVEESVSSDDVVITMGAGDVTKVSALLVE